MIKAKPTAKPSCLPTLLISLAALLILPLLGMLAGVQVLDWFNAGGGRSWQALGEPPVAVTGIETGDLDVVFVRSGEGMVFECRHRGGDGAEGDCWQVTEPPFEVDPDVQQQIIEPVQSKAPPGSVADSLTVTKHHAEAVSQVRYVLLADGSVWLWRYGVDAYTNLFGIVVSAFCGLALALPIVLLLGLRLLRARREEAAG